MPYGQPMTGEQRLQWKGGAVVSYSSAASSQWKARGWGGLGGVWSLPLVCDACFTVAGHIREEPEKNRRHVCGEQALQRLRAEN